MEEIPRYLGAPPSRSGRREPSRHDGARGTVERFATHDQCHPCYTFRPGGAVGPDVAKGGDMDSVLVKAVLYGIGSVLLFLIVRFIAGLFLSDGAATTVGVIFGILGFLYAWVAPDSPR